MKYELNRAYEAELIAKINRAKTYLRGEQNHGPIQNINIDIVRAFEELKLTKPEVLKKAYPHLTEQQIREAGIKEMILPESFHGDYDAGRYDMWVDKHTCKFLTETDRQDMLRTEQHLSLVGLQTSGNSNMVTSP